MAVTTRRSNGTAPDVAELADRIAELERRAAVRDRIFANVAARLAPTRWTEFKQLLSSQYNVTYADAEAFMEILTGRKP